MGLVARCLYPCTRLVFSLLAAWWLVQLLPSHPCSRQEKGDRRNDCIGCICAILWGNKSFPRSSPSRFPLISNRPELTLGATHTWNGDGESMCIWFSSFYNGEQQRLMVFRMALGQLIYSVSCKGTISQEYGKVRSGRQLERWVEARLQRIIKV